MQEDGGLIVRKWSAVPLRETPDGVRCGALRRRVHATDAPAKVQRCTCQLQSFALPHGATFALLPSATFALPRVPPLRFPLFCLCAIASASMQVGDTTGACQMRHTALPRNGGAMQNAAGNPIRKKVPAIPESPSALSAGDKSTPPIHQSPNFGFVVTLLASDGVISYNSRRFAPQGQSNRLPAW